MTVAVVVGVPLMVGAELVYLADNAGVAYSAITASNAAALKWTNNVRNIEISALSTFVKPPRFRLAEVDVIGRARRFRCDDVLKSCLKVSTLARRPCA